jgi:hypothetical protein
MTALPRGKYLQTLITKLGSVKLEVYTLILHLTANSGYEEYSQALSTSQIQVASKAFMCLYRKGSLDLAKIVIHIAILSACRKALGFDFRS